MFDFKNVQRVAGVALVSLALVACDDDPTGTPEPRTISATAAATGDLSTLVTALQGANLVATLEGDGPFTVFAPRNAAFAALDDAVLSGLLEEGNVDLLSRILTFHVVPAAARSTDLSDGQTLTTVEGGTLTVGITGGGVTVNGANVISADIEASNGVVHIIDGVLLPSDTDIYESAVLTAGTTTLGSTLLAAGLDDDLRGAASFTVFAPVNSAFEALGTDRLEVLLDPANADLLAEVLTYHVISGDIRAADLMDGQIATTLSGADVTIDLSDPSMPKVNAANIIATDIVTENGVIHLIDGVLTENLDLVDIATVEGFSTLVALVEQQGLTATLRSDNMGAGFTVFAPTEDAFAALASVPTGQALTDVLTYHVLDAEVASSSLSDGLVVTNTVNGASFTVNISGSDVTITDQAGNTVDVVLTDVPAANGIIHVIDGVIVPTP